MSFKPRTPLSLLPTVFFILFFLSGGCKKDETVITTQQGDTQQPTVSILSPAQGSLVQGVDTITVSATDNVGVTRVEMYLNSQLSATKSSQPWFFVWPTTQFADSAYNLQAKAYDAAGNVGLSAAVAVTVRNSTTSSIVALVSGSPNTSSVLPGVFSFNQPTNYWSVVGLRPPTGADYDLSLYNDSALTTPLAVSNVTTGIDIVVGDHNYSRQGLHYLKAVQYSGSGAYDIEWENGPDLLTVPSASAPISWGGTTVVKIWDVQLAAGTSYTFTLTITSGTANLGIALFKPTGAAYYAGKSAAVATADANGNGQGESFSYSSTTAGYYGFAVWGNTAASANFTIRVQ